MIEYSIGQGLFCDPEHYLYVAAGRTDSRVFERLFLMVAEDRREVAVVELLEYAVDKCNVPVLRYLQEQVESILQREQEYLPNVLQFFISRGTLVKISQRAVVAGDILAVDLVVTQLVLGT